MGDFNPSSPTLLGQEWQPLSELALQFSSPASGWAQRIRPGANTLAAIHRYHQEVVGSAPGIALEVVDTLMPALSTSTFFPGTDLGSLTTTGWQDQAAAAATFARVDDKTDTSDYVRNSTAIGITEQRNIRFRGAAAALAGKRIAAVFVGAMVRVFQFSDLVDVGVESALTLGGGNYYSPLRRIPNDGRWYTPFLLGAWRLNPATDKPFTQAEVNNFITAAGTDSFGLRISYPRPTPAAATAVSVAGLWVDVLLAAENRIGGFYYDTKKMLRYWQRFPMSSAGLLAANTHYWLVEYPLVGGTANYARGVAHTDPSAVEPASAAATTGEHRELVAVTLNNGVVTAVAPDRRTVQDSAVTSGTIGQLMGGVLLEGGAGAILSQSDPYVQLDRRKIASDSIANLGQSITSPGANNYGAIVIPVAWNRAGVRPDRELVIEIRTAINGGGAVVATATIQPDDIDGTLQRKQVPFAANFAAAAAQYFVHIRSSASTLRGWDILRQDTHSELIDSGAGTTLANIEGATQGGTTDAYFEGATALTRYDIPLELVAAPAAPAGFTAVALPAVVGAGSVNNAPPRVLCSWTATALGASFVKYRLWSRPSRTPAVQPQLRAEIVVNAGQTPATVEAQHTRFLDKSPGWTRQQGVGQWGDGWDFWVTVVNANGMESGPSTIATRVQLTPDLDSWLTNNAAPWLDAPVWAQELQGEDQGTLNTYTPLGRDFLVTRTRSELPGRLYKVGWDSMQAVAEDGIRHQRAAAASGRQLVLNTPAGDRVIGSISAPRAQQTPADFVDSEATFAETARQPEVADYNLPAGLVLNGTSQALTIAHNALIDPLAGPFTLIIVATFAGAGSTKGIITKGNLAGAGNGFGIRTNAVANQLDFYTKGATGTVRQAVTAAAAFDGNVHVLAMSYAGGAGGELLGYLDASGTPIASTTGTAGSLTNTVALAAGGDNGGTAAWSAMAPLHGLAYYPRVLTPAEIVAAARDLLFYPNARMPGGSTAFVDLRDQRTWNGVSTLNIVDTSSVPPALTVATVANPTPRGLPWPLQDLDKF